MTFDAQTLEALRQKPAFDEWKVFNLVHGLQQVLGDNRAIAPALLALRDRAERILRDLESRTVMGLAALDLLEGIAAEKVAAMKAAAESGLSPRAFAVFWLLKDRAELAQRGIDPLDFAREVERLTGQFPSSAANVDEQRKLRSALYRPLLELPREQRAKLVDDVIAVLHGKDAR